MTFVLNKLIAQVFSGTTCMIMYKFDEELQYAIHYANKLSNREALRILALGEISDANDAIILCKFFWKMVATTIEEELSGIIQPWTETTEFLNNKIKRSFSSYLIQAGYAKEWEALAEQN